ncbi:MAG: hypothetical protein U1F43_10130 [Myxococcota bacterium]
MASLGAGGSTVCTPGFDAGRVFGWLAASGATWLTAVPTMHQALLARAGSDEARAALGRSRLRFVRSSSSALRRRRWSSSRPRWACR